MARLMKQSGVDWIGDIPDDWSVLPARYVFSEVCTKNTDGAITNALKFYNGNIIPKTNFDAESDDYVADTIINYTVVNPDTIVINGLNLNYDLKSLRVGLVKELGVITSAYLALCPNKSRIIPKYANYLLKGYEVTMAFHNMGAGIRKTLGFKEFKRQLILIPPIDEQERIAAYLDDKCGRIDSVIAKTVAAVAEYKKLKQAIITRAVTRGIRPNRTLKHSGIEWLGDIPDDWNVSKIKNNFTVHSGATPKSEVVENWDGNIVWITPADYKTADRYISCGKRNLSEVGYRSCGTTLVPSGSIIFSKRAPIGTVAIAAVELCTNQGCLSCVPKADTDSGYYYYVMSAFTEQFNLLGTGTTFKEISYEVFRSFKVPCPLIDEQREIAAYLDEKTSAIDSLVAKKNQLVAELERLKKSLIFEYVTGKKEVAQ